MAIHSITLKINGEVETTEIPSQMTLLSLLRERLSLTGTKNGCAGGECGACTVLLDGEPVNSCMILAVECDRADITTIEGLEKDGKLQLIQEVMVQSGAVQCGFCTPGVLISAYALLKRVKRPNDEEIQAALVGNLCRCTGYSRIIDSVKLAATMDEEYSQ